MTKLAKVITQKKIHSGQFSVRMDEFIFNNKKIKKEIVEHSPSVGIIPIINDQVLLITQYRHAVGKTLLEIPAGKIEKNESIKIAAKRELYEETGYTGKFFHLFNWYLVPGYGTEIMSIFVATNLKMKSISYGYDDDENIKLKRLKLKTAFKKCITGDIVDCKTIAALLMYKEYSKSLNLTK
ncbi:MAG: NUDIX hydrolase [Nitrososphaeraceae archaeon]